MLPNQNPNLQHQAKILKSDIKSLDKSSLKQSSRSFSTMTSSQFNYSTSADRPIPSKITRSRFCSSKIVILAYFISMLYSDSMPTSVTALSPRVQQLHSRLKKFIDEKVVPIEAEVYAHVTNPDPKVRWSIPPVLETLKVTLRMVRNMTEVTMIL